MWIKEKHNWILWGCLSLRVENRPSVLGIFIYVPWGGVGWGGAITFTYLRTPMMLRHGTFTCTCAHTSCYVEDVSRHAGWGNVHVRAHSYDVKGFDCISRMHSGQKRTVVCSDGAKCYPGLTSANKLIHFACSHRKNPFVKKIRRHAGKTFWVHTGTIDSCWRMIKASVPDQLTSCPENEQKLNELIWTYVRTWQWRWEANVVGKAPLEKTGAYLAKM